MRPLILAMLASLAATPAAAVPAATVATQTPATGTLVLPLARAADLAAVGTSLDAAARDAVGRALSAAAFDYKARSSLSLHGIGGYDRLLIVGLGDKPPTPLDLRALGGITAREAGKDKAVALVASQLPATAAADVVLGYRLGSYSFDTYKKPEKPAARAALTIVGSGDPEGAAAVADAVVFARDLVAEPANIIYPESFVERTRAAFAGVAGVRIEVLDVPAMEKLGMGAILSVGKGSVRPPRLLMVEYKGAGAPARPIVLPGKGITFDSGGISLKAGAGMWRMKNDMAGAASVVGGVLALA
ncbi:MAG: M17 family peptidase N-terminal domain-containing protein, partial [Sphingomonadaceae bacterium]|nr:M17 family peptidase N-terminal domain-containing protein [Sphingomonadaceae bacterium]